MAAALAGAAILAAGHARAADFPAPALALPETPVLFDVAFNAKVLTDYNFRGISQTDRQPAVQGYAELQFWNNLFYAGVFGSNVELPTKPDAEIDFTAGVRPKIGPVTFDFGVISYYYPGERRLFDPFTTVTYTLPNGNSFDGPVFLTPKNTDYTEVVGRISYSWEDKLILGAGVYHAWDWLGSGATATYFNGTAKYNIPEGALGFLPAGFAITGEIAFYDLGRTSPQLGSIKLEDYAYWNAGVSYTWKNLTFDVRYHDTDLSKEECFTNTTDPQGYFSGSGRSNWCDRTFIASLSVDFTLSGLGVLPK